MSKEGNKPRPAAGAPTVPLKYPKTIGTQLAKASGNVVAAVVGAGAPEGPPARVAAGKGEAEGGAAAPAAGATVQSLLAQLDEVVKGEGEAADEGKGGGKGGVNNKVVMAILVQLDARLRDLEALAYTVAIMSASHLAAVGGLRVADGYRKAVRAKPKTHGLGSATPLVALSFLSGVVEAGLTATQREDPAVFARYLAVTMFTAFLRAVPAGQIEAVVRHFFVVEAYVEDTVKLIYNIEGTMAIPSTTEEATQVETAIREAESTQKDDAVVRVAAQYFTYEDLTCTGPPGRKSYAISKILRTLLCSTGANIPSSRPPPGPLIRKIRRRRGNKKKGKGSAFDMEDGEDEEDDF